MPEHDVSQPGPGRDTVSQRGHYNLYETNHEHRILDLNGKHWFAWIHTSKGAILVLTDSHHDEVKKLQSGKFLMVKFEGDPEFKDMPHLFLENQGKYEELILPNGLPSNKDEQKKVIKTRFMLNEQQLQEHLKKAG